MIRPDASLPKLEPIAEIVTYHARTSALVLGVVSWDSTDLEYLLALKVVTSVLQLTPRYFEMVQNRHLRAELTYVWAKILLGHTCDTDHAHHRSHEQDQEVLKYGKDQST